MDETTPSPPQPPETQPGLTPPVPPVQVSPQPSPPESTPSAPQPKPQRSGSGIMIGVAAFAAALVLGFAVGRYLLPAAPKTTDNTTNSPSQHTQLEVPKNATVIAECAIGRGKQYVLPEDIPTGPVYNVWDNKVIGLEFMVGRDELLSENKTLVNLPLNGAVYDHINIGLLSGGHSGFPQPHYHVDLFTVSNSEAEKITCQ